MAAMAIASEHEASAGAYAAASVSS